MKFPERQKTIHKWLAELGFRQPVFFHDEFGNKNRSNCQNHLSAISSAHPPLLVLEDDAIPTEHFTPVIDVPSDASAIYLGTSTWGLGSDGAGYGKVLAIGSLSMPRVLNMLGLHAVLYLARAYAASTKELLTTAVFDSACHPSDVLIASRMADWQVYATNPPQFFQQDGINDSITQQPLAVLAVP